MRLSVINKASAIEAARVRAGEKGWSFQEPIEASEHHGWFWVGSASAIAPAGLCAAIRYSVMEASDMARTLGIDISVNLDI